MSPCDPNLSQLLGNRCSIHLTRSVRRRAASFKRASGKLPTTPDALPTIGNLSASVLGRSLGRRNGVYLRLFGALRVRATNVGTSLGTKPRQTSSKTVLRRARKCKKSQLHNVSGVISGLEVRALRGSPLLPFCSLFSIEWLLTNTLQPLCLS